MVAINQIRKESGGRKNWVRRAIAADKAYEVTGKRQRGNIFGSAFVLENITLCITSSNFTRRMLIIE